MCPIADNVVLGKDVVIHHPELVNLYGCWIGDGCKIASFVEIGSRVSVGHRCSVQAFVYIPSGVLIGNDVFIGPHVCFTNDLYPPSGKRWPTMVEDKVSIGAGAVILCGVRIGRNAKIAAGTVVIRDVPADAVMVGNPARRIRRSRKWG